MLSSLDLSKVLFLDIETVPSFQNWDEVPERLKPLWEKKAATLRGAEEESVEESWSRAGIYAEFGKIVCISVGFLRGDGAAREFRTKSFFDHDEKRLLSEFAELLDQNYQSRDSLLCAHNGKEFDFPYIARRMLINGVEIPGILDTAGKKPWEVSHLDTMELWKFGDRKSFTSVALLTAIFDIPTPKDDIDGSQVGRVYWEESDLARIEEYCRKDVVAVVQILLKFRGQNILKDEEITHIN
jgi:DNA polymerase elongation subunit (family B)